MWSFGSLFESRERRAAKRQVAIRMARNKIEKYVNGCRAMASEYLALGRRALIVNDRAGCDQYLARNIQYARQADKWGAFLLRMKDLSLRGEMAGSMQGLLSGVKALTRELQASVGVEEMDRVISELNLANTRLGQAEEQMTWFMEQVSVDIGSPAGETVKEPIPDDLRSEVDRLRERLVADVIVEERTGPAIVSEGRQADIDDRIRSGRERLRELRK